MQMPTPACDQNAAFAALGVGVPDDVARLAAAGYLDEAACRIETLLTRNCLPAAGRQALRALREQMRRQKDHFTLTRAEALSVLRAEISDLTDEEFDALVSDGRIDWRFQNGEPRYHARFAESLRLYPDLNARGLAPEPSSDFRARAVAALQARGSLSATITIEAQIAPAAGLAPAPDAPFEAWLPIPAACAEQGEIEILSMTPGGKLAPADAPQRTVHWAGRAGDAPYTVTYRYKIRATCRDMDNLLPDPAAPAPVPDDLAEQAPHIAFTPWLRSLCEQITAGCETPLEKARAIYDYVTKNTRYRYQPAYVCLGPIADGCAKSGWGDCGVMALLFITLCRIASIPARWQSGLYVTDEEAGCHDWAQFYLEGYGWFWADCSFGASAHRRGDEATRRHYFGNLDPLRMVANRAFFAQLTPPDNFWRNDPYDNQVGEAVLAGRPLHGDDLEASRRVLAFTLDAPLPKVE